MIYIKERSANLSATVANKRSHVNKELVDDLILKIWKTRNFWVRIVSQVSCRYKNIICNLSVNKLWWNEKLSVWLM